MRVFLLIGAVALWLAGCNAKEPQPTQAQLTRGAKLYAGRCITCHGADGRRDTSGRGSVIAGRDAAWIAANLKGYRTGKLSLRGLGAVMKMQIANRSDEDIAALAAYISKL